jgi:hypothetical protein
MRFNIRKKANTNNITPLYVPGNFLGIWVNLVLLDSDQEQGIVLCFGDVIKKRHA